MRRIIIILSCLLALTALTSALAFASFAADGDGEGEDLEIALSEEISTPEVILFESGNQTPAKGSSVILSAPYIDQKAIGFPNGCESVSTVMALQYLGEKIDTETFVSNYLPMGPAPSYGVGSNPWKVYVGNPRLTNGQGWGCYAPVIVEAVDKYADKTKIYVTDVSASSLQSLCSNYIRNGVPVIIWGTVEMTRYVSYSYWVTPEGDEIYYNNRLHCLLLVGYDDNYYYFNDPLKRGEGHDYYAYTKSDVEAAYQLLNYQAVVIRPAEVTGLSVVSYPNVTGYFLNDELDLTGLCLTAEYNSGATATGVSGYTVSGFDSESGGTKTVTVTYKGKSVSFDVTVEDYEYMKGDANADGEITMSDVLAMRKYIAGIEDLSSLAFYNADTDSDNDVTMSDVLYDRKFIAGIIKQ